MAGCRGRPVLDLSYSYLGAAGSQRCLLLWLEAWHIHLYKGLILTGKVRQQLIQVCSHVVTVKQMMAIHDLREKTLLEVSMESVTFGRATLGSAVLLSSARVNISWMVKTYQLLNCCPISPVLSYIQSSLYTLLVFIHAFPMELKDQMLGELVCRNSRVGPNLGQGCVLLKLSCPLSCILIGFYLFSNSASEIKPKPLPSVSGLQLLLLFQSAGKCFLVQIYSVNQYEPLTVTCVLIIS